MPVPPDRSFWLDLKIDPDNPNLLTGLENWLELGLIDDRQIRELAALFLTCRLAEVAVEVPIPELQLPVEPERSIPTPAKLRQPSLVSTMWTAFKDELSVRWLLFLGVFLVILSSGALAATQWQQFPAWGQYGVLWVYTIAFWGVGFWARGQVGLSLTANTLQIVALLLIPVNFWAIDSFQLWRNPGELLTAAVGVGSLSVLALIDARLRQQRSGLSRIAIVYLGLSYLQLGWQIPLWATLAVYVGAIGGVGLWQRRQQIFGDSLAERLRQRWQWASLAIYSLAVLLLRALFIVGLPAHNFGLAIGIIGWLVAQWGLQEWGKIDRIDALLARAGAATVTRAKYLSQRRASAMQLADKYQTGAVLLLLLGWLLALSQWSSTSLLGSSWQPVAVDGLILVWLGQRLQRRSYTGDLCWMFIVGLQTYGASLAIAPDLIPLTRWDFWGYLLPIFGANPLWAGTLIGMPYLFLWIGISEWLRRSDSPGERLRQRLKLSQTAVALVFGYGLLLNLLSLPNHLGLLINLVLSTLGLIYLTHRGAVRTPLIYVTHFYGLATIAVGLGYALPNLNSNVAMWGTIATGGAIGEWLISTLPAASGSVRDRWYRSAWHFGIGLAGIGYLAYLICSIPLFYDSPWIWLWFSVPVTLTWLGSRSLRSAEIEIPRTLPWQVNRQVRAASLSVASLILVQGLTIAYPDRRLVGALVAVGLMWFDVRRLRTLPVAAIHVGFGLYAIAIGIERWISSSNWLVIGAIVCLGLWIAAERLRRLEGDLPPLYARSSDGWALGLSGVGVAIASITYYNNYLPWLATSAWQWHHPSIAIASAILAIGLWYRDRLFSQAWTIWVINWTLQLGLAELIHILGGNALTLAIVDIAIAFPLLAYINFPLVRNSPPRRGARQGGVGEGWINTNYISMLPWCYAILGLGLRLPYFNDYTGTLTIAVGIISLIVGRQLLTSLTYFGFIAIVLGGYELVTYQLLQATAGGNFADALTIYGLATAVLALGYRLSIAWWERQGKSTWLNLPLDFAKTIAHIHWLGASGWKIAAALITFSSEPKLTPIHLATSVLLGIYAIVQGRDRTQKGDWWVYVGIVEILGTGIYARSIFRSLSSFDEFIILAACFVGIAILLSPWQSWGWQDRPWRRVAVILPLLRVVFVTEQISLLNLLILASFYAGVAKRQKQFGWVYVSLIFLDWAAFRALSLYNLQDPLWFVAIAGISLILSVQFDPYFQQREQRRNRHLARSIASGAIALTALLIHQHQPLVPAGISLLLTLAGIALSIRAFLYVGTITLMLTASYQLVILITEYSFTKWIVGSIAGIIIIAIAGNFERRREQIYTTVHHWLDRLEEWE